MYGSRTDKAHSQNGDHIQHDDYDRPRKNWVRSNERAGLEQVIVSDLQDWADEQAIATDGFGPTDVQQHPAAGEQKENGMEIYQGVGEQIDVEVAPKPKRAPVDRQRIEFLLSKQAPMASTGNNPFSRPTEDVRLYDPETRTRRGMKVG